MGHVTARQLQLMSKQNGGCSEEKESENAEAKSYFYFNLVTFEFNCSLSAKFYAFKFK